jgi:AcrR family transcriptional regulator
MYDVASKNSSAGNPPSGGRPPASAHLRQAIVDKVVDSVTAKITSAADREVNKLGQQAEKINAKADKISAHAEKLSAHAARTAERLDRLGEHLSSLDVWTRVEPGTRKPRFTREEIAVAAVLIADTEGLEALSMRRLAAELDAGTMTLYHYVRTKDELLTLALDQVMAEVVVHDPLPDDWRDAITKIADSSRRALLRHSWIFDVTDDINLGPNSVRHFDQSLQALSSLPVQMSDRLDILTTVDEYVFGHCLQQRNAPVGRQSAGAENALHHTKMYIDVLLKTGDFPELSAWIAEDGFDETWLQVQTHAEDPDRFERNLGRILDGIQADLDRRKTPRT